MGIPRQEDFPTSNSDGNQQTDDENVQVKYLFEVVDMFASLFHGNDN